jgi:hypothetical protein
MAEQSFITRWILPTTLDILATWKAQAHETFPFMSAWDSM